jgi:hypothetical protein
MTILTRVSECPKACLANAIAVSALCFISMLTTSVDALGVEMESTSVCTAVCAGSNHGFGGDVWELSTRHLSCVDSRRSGWADKLQVSKWNGNNWTPASLDQAIYRSSDTIVAPRTIFYVHGNWMERDNARTRVGIVDRQLSRRATEPYRLIMLSWPSERNQPVLKDIRSNAALADANSVVLAELLGLISESSTQVSLIGFSLGARTVAGGLHIDAKNAAPHPNYRVSFVAPAEDRNWLQPCGKHSLALSHVDQLVNLYNSKDPILRRFRFIDLMARPTAAGFAGFEGISTPRSTKPLPNNPIIRQYDCGSAIGATHSEVSYYGECPYFCIAIDNLLGK